MVYGSLYGHVCYNNGSSYFLENQKITLLASWNWLMYHAPCVENQTTYTKINNAICKLKNLIERLVT